jgi:hypothetical protein
MPSSWPRWTVLAALTAAGLILCAVIAARAVGLAGIRHETGYFSPLFAPDGASVFVIRRDVRAFVIGPGREFFTPPARVRVLSDRLALLDIRLSDGHVTVVETFPPSPLEGATIQAYHGGIFGSAHGHLRWADSTHLDYEVALTRYDSPLSRTFVTRRVWNPKSKSSELTGPWKEGSPGMAGDEPQQLAGEREVIAMPGSEGMPCAIVVRRQDGDAAALVESGDCRSKYRSGYSRDVVAPFSRRAAIERSELIRRTYADLVDRARRNGVPEGQAMLDANDEMSRLGLYPRQTMLVAEHVDCAAATGAFDITAEQFTVGLFPDIERAIASPGQPVHKSMGSYITHRDYTTSQQLNAYLAAGHSTFLVRSGGRCWRLSIER